MAMAAGIMSGGLKQSGGSGQEAYEKFFKNVDHYPDWYKLSEKQQARWQRVADHLIAINDEYHSKVAQYASLAKEHEKSFNAQRSELEKSFSEKQHSLTIKEEEYKRATERSKLEAGKVIAEVRNEIDDSKKAFEARVEKRVKEVVREHKEQEAEMLRKGFLPPKPRVVCGFASCNNPTEWNLHKEGDRPDQHNQVCGNHLSLVLEEQKGSYQVTLIGM